MKKSRMRVKNLKLKNIGVFDEEELTFPSFNSTEKADIYIFTGTNGSGKSTLLFALASAFDYFEKGHKHHVSNFFYKRFKFFEREEGSTVKKKESDKNYKSEAVVCFDDEPCVKIYGCPNCKGVHASTKNKKIDNYSNFIIIPPPDEFEFEFAAFAYSGYRYVKSEDVNTITTFAGNPLYQSLEFIKNRAELNNMYSINQWILNNFSNEALLLKMGDVNESKKFASSLENFKKFISDIIEKEIDFVVKLNPTRLYIKIDDEELDFDVLPDGLKSLISWVGDLMMIMDQLKWKDNIPLFERNFLLFLDEIEVHLHPAWQRKILPVIQNLFVNSQIFLSTHSPFIVNSVDNAYIYELDYNDGTTVVREPAKSKTSNSISYTLQKVFGIKSEFGESLRVKLDDFYNLKDEILQKNIERIGEFVDVKNQLLSLDDLEVRDVVEFEVNQLYKITKLESLLK